MTDGSGPGMNNGSQLRIRMNKNYAWLSVNHESHDSQDMAIFEILSTAHDILFCIDHNI